MPGMLAKPLVKHSWERQSFVLPQCSSLTQFGTAGSHPAPVSHSGMLTIGVLSLHTEATLQNGMAKGISLHFELQRQLEEQSSPHSPAPTGLQGQIRVSFMADEDSSSCLG